MYIKTWKPGFSLDTSDGTNLIIRIQRMQILTFKIHRMQIEVFILSVGT